MAPRRVTRNSWCHRLWVLKKEQRKEILPRLRVVQWHEFFFTTGLPLRRHGHHWSLPLAEEADQSLSGLTLAYRGLPYTPKYGPLLDFFEIGLGETTQKLVVSYSPSCSICPRVGLCFSEDFLFFFRSGTTCSVPGAPMRSRAISFTACTAENFFGFFFLATAESVSAIRACDIIGLSGGHEVGPGKLATDHRPLTTAYGRARVF